MSRWPVIRWRDGGGLPRRVVVEDFDIEIDGERLTVPAGFDDFDGASIPRWLWTTVGHPFMREFERAALVHDYLYAAPDARRAQGVDDRARVDALFYAQLLQDGVRRPKAKRMRWAVERFGAERFVAGPSDVPRTREELAALEAQDCSCAQDEIQALIAAGGRDPELLQSFREIDWDIVGRLF